MYKILNNYITREYSYDGHVDGIELEYSCENVISNNYIQYMERCCIKICKNSNNNQILNNKIGDCKYGIYSSESGGLVILDNSVSNGRKIGVFLSNGNNIEIKRNNMSLNSNGIYLENSFHIDI